MIAALGVLLIILMDFLRKRRIEDANNRIFSFFIVLGLFDVAFDIITTALMAETYPEMAVFSQFILTLFYLMQVCMPCAMLNYTLTLRTCSKQKLVRKSILSIIPAGVMAVIVLLNGFTGSLFVFDAAGVYHRGPWYYLTYGYAIAYGLLVVIGTLTHLSELTPKKILVIFEYIFIEFVCVLVQAATGLLTTGFGIALGILVLYMTINNPTGFIDSLTSAYNNEYFRLWMRERIMEKNEIHLLVVKLRTLRQINKTYGTELSDELLVSVVKYLHTIGPNVFRISGSQFAVACSSLADYEIHRRNLRDYLNDSLTVHGENILCPAAICGIINAGELGEGNILENYIEHLVSLTPVTNETVLIQSDEHTLKGFRYEQEIEHFLQSAIENDLFEVWYQPVYSLADGRFASLEALSRLRHPSLGPVSPDVFISIAERSGQIDRIGLLQFARICRFVDSHRELMDEVKNIKFNLSPVELLRTGHVARLIALIRKYNLPTSFFQFEITETVATEYNDSLISIIREMKAAGINICLDDFGSGYANLNTVLRLPFSCVKLDRSMLRGITEGNQFASFYRSLVSILKNLGFVVISEGVEEEAEVNLLRSWGVDMIQGYYFSRPLPTKELLAKLLPDKFS